MSKMQPSKPRCTGRSCGRRLKLWFSWPPTKRRGAETLRFVLAPGDRPVMLPAWVAIQ